MKKQLLLKFAAFIVAAILFSAKTNAQIVYTDIVPDESYSILSLTSQTYNLDLNGDGTTDFGIRSGRIIFTPLSLTISEAGITPQGSSAVVAATLNTIKKLVIGDTISSSQVWHDSTFQILKRYAQRGISTPTDTGEWDSVVDGYVGLQLLSGSQIYYGWVRMDVTVSMSSSAMTIKDFAYNTIPNQLILAGQTIATGLVENSFASAISIYPNPSKDQFTVEFGSTSQQVDVTILDLSGKAIYTSTTNEANKLEVNTTEFAEGIYMVKIQSGESVATKKLVIAR